VNVTYSYVPYGLSEKTLVGLSAFWMPEGSVYSLSSTWLYNQTDNPAGPLRDRPRLGQEPTRTLLGDLNAKANTRADWLSGVAAHVPASMAGFPPGWGPRRPWALRPESKHKGSLYMTTLRGSRPRRHSAWTGRRGGRAAFRFRAVDGRAFPPAERDSIHVETRGELWWYFPREAVREKDLRPSLSQPEGDQNHPVLGLQFFPRSTMAAPESSWAGVVQVLSAQGQDLSRAQFLEL